MVHERVRLESGSQPQNKVVCSFFSLVNINYLDAQRGESIKFFTGRKFCLKIIFLCFFLLFLIL